MTSPLSQRYAGKVAIVTGAGAGIGQAMTRRLLAEGAVVVANDRNPDSLTALATEHTGGRLITASGDVSDPALPAHLVDLAVGSTDTGRIDALFNHAGVGSATSTLDLTEAEWSKVMSINVDSVFRIAQAAGRVMVTQGGGAILNTASIAGTHGLPGRLAYVASKHAVVGITRALAVEWGPYGVRVNAICPGLTETVMSQKLREDHPDYWAAREAIVPLRRASTASEQAATALFLNSDDAGSVSGLIATVDGAAHTLHSGYTVSRPGD